MYWLAAISVSAFRIARMGDQAAARNFRASSVLADFSLRSPFLGLKGGFLFGADFHHVPWSLCFTRIFLPDVILSFFIAFCMYMYLQISLESETEPRKIGPVDLRCAGLYASAALAVLTKGMIGVVFTGAVIFFHMLITGNWKVVKRLQIGYGILIFVLIAAPWHIAAAIGQQ